MQWGQVLFLSVLVAVALGRLLELRRSKKNMAGQTAPKWEGHYVAMVGVHSLLFVLPVVEVFVLERPFHGALAVFGLLLVGLATALRLWVIRLLGRSWNTRGLVDEDVKIVVSGPYRYIRHPNYLAVCLEIAALPLIHGAWISALVLSVANGLVLAIRIPWEERQLFEIPGYAEAFANKSRLIPGFASREDGD